MSATEMTLTMGVVLVWYVGTSLVKQRRPHVGSYLLLIAAAFVASLFLDI